MMFGGVYSTNANFIAFFIFVEPDESKSAAIIGGVFGGVVFIVLVVILGVWCTKKSSNNCKPRK